MERDQAPKPTPERRTAPLPEFTTRELGFRALSQCPACGHELDLPPPARPKLGDSSMALVDANPTSPRRGRSRKGKESGVRVSIPGHPEIVAYKMTGTQTRDRTVDDLFDILKISSREATSATD